MIRGEIYETVRNRETYIKRLERNGQQDLYEYGKSELVGPSAGWMPHKNEQESKEIIEMFISNKDLYAIVLKSENKVVGGVGLHDRKPDESVADLKQKEIGYVLNPKYWGKGIVPEAVQRLIEYGFEELDLDLIWCGHYDFNIKSKRVNEKCGFRYRFKKKERIKLLADKEVTTLYYSILKSEYYI